MNTELDIQRGDLKQDINSVYVLALVIISLGFICDKNYTLTICS